MTNPRMLERNKTWKRRLTALGVAAFVGLSALIGKQAEESQAVTAASTSAGTTASASTSNASSATTATATPATTTATTTASSASSMTTVHTRTGSSQ